MASERVELQQKIRTEAESVLEEELDEKHRERDLRQQFRHNVTETTTTCRWRQRSNIRSPTSPRLCTAGQGDLQAVTEELSDVRKVLDSHVSEPIACKVSMANRYAAACCRTRARQVRLAEPRRGTQWRACALRLWTSRTQRRAKFDSHLILLQAILFMLPRRARCHIGTIQSHTYTTARRRRLDRTFRILNTTVPSYPYRMTQ